MTVVDVTCPNPACGAKLKAPADYIGKKAKCNRCRQDLRVFGTAPFAGAPRGIRADVLPAPDADPIPMALPVDDGGPVDRPTSKTNPTPTVQKLEELPPDESLDTPLPAPKPVSSTAKVAAKPAAPVAKTKAGPPVSGARPSDLRKPAPKKPETKKVEPEPLPLPEVDDDSPFAFAGALKAKKLEPPDDEGGDVHLHKKTKREEPSRKNSYKNESLAKSHIDGEEVPRRPQYQRPQGKTGKALLISMVAAGLVTVGVVAAVVIAHIRSNKTETVKKEEKKQEPTPAVVPPIQAPSSPALTVAANFKPKESDLALRAGEKTVPVPTRTTAELAGKFRSFSVGTEPVKFEAADRAGEPRFIVETPFTSVVCLFPSSAPRTLDTYLVSRTGTGFSLDAYSPSSLGRAGRLEFAADPFPLCDVYSSQDRSEFVAASGGRVTVWNLADQKKVIDALDPYESKPGHAKDGLSAVLFGPNPDFLVTVSTAGAVHLIDRASKSVTTEFVPPRGTKGAVALGASVARAGPHAIVLAVGGIVYQIKLAPGLERVRAYDLGGDVKPLALAAGGAPGRVVFAFETETKGKKEKDRALLYLPLGDAKPSTFEWSAAAGIPCAAFWANDTEVGVVTERGVVWFGEDERVFGPMVVTRPATTGLYAGAPGTFWYVVPRPSKPAQSVMVPLAVPFGSPAALRDSNPNAALPVARIDSNGLSR